MEFENKFASLCCVRPDIASFVRIALRGSHVRALTCDNGDLYEEASEM